MPPRPAALAFDLDGTLVDSAADLTAAANTALAAHDRAPLTVAAVKTMIGDGVEILVHRAFAASGGPLPPEVFAGALALFHRAYAADAITRTRPYPGVATTLARLAEAGHVLGVCTNKGTQAARAVLAGCGLEGFFASVIGGDALAVRKPDPAHLLAVLAELGRDASQPAAMIGDNANDVSVARAAGVPVVAVRYGYPRMDPERLGADRLIDRFADLPETLDDLLAPCPAACGAAR